MPIFNGANNFETNGGEFTDVQGNQYIINIGTYLDLDALNHAAAQIPNVGQHKALCELFLDRMKNFLLELDKEQSQTPLTDNEVEKVNSVCEQVDNVVTTLASKDLAWRLYHSEKIISQLKDAEDTITLLTHQVHPNHFGKLTEDYFSDQLQTAQEKDRHSFAEQLNQAARSRKSLLDVLGVEVQGGRNKQYAVSNLAAAFTKRSATLPPTTPEFERQFVNTAARVLRRLSNPASLDQLPSWHLNTLEVIYDTNQSSLLGRGGFGSVYRGEWNGLAVAVKVMDADMAHINDDVELKVFLREVQTWATLRHPHILPFYGACFTAPKPFIVSSLCHHGNARQFLRKFPESDRMTMLYQITLAMSYLHEKDIIHCDLKADNILIDKNKTAMVADFGVSSILDRWSSSSSGHHANIGHGNGTLRWTAPERLNGLRAEKPSDVYSFGITAWELYSDGQIPFSGLADDVVILLVLNQARRPFQPSSLRDDVWNIITTCWQPEPKKRPTFGDIKTKLRMLIDKSTNVQDIGSLITALTIGRPVSACEAPFDDAVDVGRWPNTYDIDRIKKIIVSHGNILDGIRVTYRLKDSKMVEVTHGGPWYTPGDSRVSKIDMADSEVISKVQGYHGDISGGFGADITEITFVILNKDTGFIRKAGPFGKIKRPKAFRADGPFIAFAGGCAFDVSRHKPVLRALSFLKWSSSDVQDRVIDDVIDSNYQGQIRTVKPTTISPLGTIISALAIGQSAGSYPDPFDDSIVVGHWPNSFDIVRIGKVIVSHGDIIDGIRVTYQLKNGRSIEVTHGGPWYTPGDSRVTTVNIADYEVINKVQGYHGDLSGGYGVEITEMTFDILNENTGSVRKAGPFGKIKTTVPYRADGPFVAFAGGCAFDSIHCCPRIKALSFLTWS